MGVRLIVRAAGSVSVFDALRNIKEAIWGRKGKLDLPSANGSYAGISLDKSLDANLNTLKAIFRDCDDVVYRQFKIAGRISAALIFIDGMIKVEAVDEYIMKPLMLESYAASIPMNSAKDALRYAKETIISTTNFDETRELEQVLFSIMAGNAVIVVDRDDRAIIVDVKGWEHRTVEQPSTELAIRGPRESFTETLRVNTALVRRRIRDPRLKLRTYRLGRRSKTDIVLMYMEDIIDPKIVEEVNRRLDGIDVDNVVGSGFIEQLIEDSWLSPFPQLKTTERPDKVVAALMEGKLCIVVDHTPYALTLPTTLNDLMQAPDDYYERWLVASLIRLTRFVGTFTALILPSLYIAMVSYFPDMIPTPLALAIAAGRENMPFPAFLEAFLMEGSFELMREAGMRLPGHLGQTMGVVGAVIIGQAAVAANIASPAMVVVVAMTGIANFAIPNLDAAISFRVLRFGLMLLATVLGLYGVIVGVLLIVSHLCILKSFGIPYMAPWVPLTWRDLKDTVLRAPWLAMHRRPAFRNVQDERRVDLDRLEEKLRRKRNPR